MATAPAPTSCGCNCRVSVDQSPGCVSVLSSLLGELISVCGSMPSHLCICSLDVPLLWDPGTLVSQTKHLLPSHPKPIPPLVFPPEEAAHPLPGYSGQSPVGHVSTLSPPTSYPPVSKPRSAPPLHHCCSFNLHRITPLHRILRGCPGYSVLNQVPVQISRLCLIGLGLPPLATSRLAPLSPRLGSL